MALNLLERQTAQCLASLCVSLTHLTDILLWLDASHRDGFVADFLDMLHVHGVGTLPGIKHLALPGAQPLKYVP